MLQKIRHISGLKKKTNKNYDSSLTAGFFLEIDYSFSLTDKFWYILGIHGPKCKFENTNRA